MAAPIDSWTGTQIAAARSALQQQAEQALGRFLFAYAQLESGLDLCLVWADQGAQLEQRTRSIERLNFAGKLGLLRMHAGLLPSAAARRAYGDWIARADRVRVQRNVLVHGRLGVDVRRASLCVAVSRATSFPVESVEFGMHELGQMVDEASSLFRELSGLRTDHPLPA